jgi:hypothetical protein
VSGAVVHLSAESVEDIACRIVELLEPRPVDAGLVDAKTVARALGVSRDYIYRHRAKLGGRQLGDGPRARLRFDLGAARAAYNGLEAAPEPTRTKRQRPRRKHSAAGVPLLPVKGAESNGS